MRSRDAFTPEGLNLIYDNLNGFTRPLFMMTVWTGLREGDICTLKWSDVDLERLLITKKTRKTGAIVQIPISDQLYSLIVATPRTGSEYVFPNHAEMYMTNGCGVSYRVKHFLEGLGFETTRVPEGRSRAISVKDLRSCRHTFCCYAGLAGIPLAVVQSIVGHMSPAMTAHYSAHASIEDKRRGMERLSFFTQDALPEAKAYEPERDELRSLADSLPIEQVHDLLALFRKISRKKNGYKRRSSPSSSKSGLDEPAAGLVWPAMLDLREVPISRFQFLQHSVQGWQWNTGFPGQFFSLNARILREDFNDFSLIISLIISLISGRFKLILLIISFVNDRISRAQCDPELGSLVHIEDWNGVSVCSHLCLDLRDSSIELVDVSHDLHCFGQKRIPVIADIGEVLRRCLTVKPAWIGNFYSATVVVELDRHISKRAPNG